uniref:G_PROTEIN_RECEP_F1_2 domain-containing protein n=2 Tax=Panagrellus redivivus TaxID=6233 RepID=A0A7E4UUW4_PANRE
MTMIVTSQFTQLCYRVSATYTPGDWCHDVSVKLVNLYVINCGATLILGVLTIVPAAINTHDPFKEQELFIDDFPALLTLVTKYPNLNGYHPDKNNISLYMLYYYGMFLAAVIYPSATILALFIVLRRMRHLKLTVSIYCTVPGIRSTSVSTVEEIGDYV